MTDLIGCVPNWGFTNFTAARANNIVCDQNTFTLNAVFVDPSAPAAERYKAINPDSQYYLRGALAPNTGQTKLEIREIAAADGVGGAYPGGD